MVFPWKSRRASHHPRRTPGGMISAVAQIATLRLMASALRA